MHMVPTSGEYTRTLGIDWNTTKDHFQFTILESPLIDNITKCTLHAWCLTSPRCWMVLPFHHQGEYPTAATLGAGRLG